MTTSSLEITESRTEPLPLSDEEAQLLRALGESLVRPDPLAPTDVAERPEVEGDGDGDGVEVEEAKRSVVRVWRTDSSGMWQVRVSNLVGIIGLNGRTLVVNPKIPLDHFVHVAFGGEVDVRDDPGPAEQGEGAAFVELLAGWYLQSVEELLHAELLRDYREVVSTGSFVRGSLLVRPTMMHLLRGQAQVTSRHDEFDRDIAVNRVLSEAARRLVGNPELRESTRRRANRIRLRFDGVGPFHRRDLAVRLDRRMARYRRPHRLATDVIRSTLRDLAPGHATSETFLIYTPTLIESGIRGILQRRLASHQVKKRSFALGGGERRMNPDLVIDGSEVTGDVKYRLAKTKTSLPWRRSELNQAVAFAAAARTTRGFIIGFSDVEDDREPELAVGDIRVRRFDWPVEDVEPSRSEDLFVEALDSWLARSDGEGDGGSDG